MSRESRVEECRESLARMAGRKVERDRLAPCLSETFTDGWIVKQVGQGQGQRLGIPLGNQETIVVVLDKFRNAGHGRGDNGKPAGHGFHEHIRNAITIAVLRDLARKGEDVGFLVEFHHFFKRLLPRECDNSFKTPLTNQRFQVGPKRPAPDDAAAKPVATKSQQMTGADECGKSLFISETAHADDGGDSRFGHAIICEQSIKSIHVETVIEPMNRGVTIGHVLEILPIVFRTGDDEFRMAHFSTKGVWPCKVDILGVAGHAVGDSRESMRQLRHRCGGIREVNMKMRDLVVDERYGQRAGLHKF